MWRRSDVANLLAGTCGDGRPSGLIMKRSLLVIGLGVLVLAALGLLALLVGSILDLEDEAEQVGDKATVAQAIAAAAGLIVSLILVAVTTWYVLETRRMVGEMRENRVSASRPSLLLRMEAVSAVNLVVGLVNAGPGAARDIELTLEFTRPAAKVKDERRWRYQYMAPGDSFQFLTLDANGSVATDFDRVLRDVAAVRAYGHARSTDGALHTVDTTLDVAAWGIEVRAAHQRVADPPSVRSAKALEKIATNMERDPFGVDRLAAAMHRRSWVDVASERVRRLIDYWRR